MRSPQGLPVDDVVEIGPAWAGHPVGFALYTHEDRQFVAYYDGDRRLTVAQRPRGSDDWTTERLPERVPWDSHNDVVLAVDAAGHVHLSGNVHDDPLVYFRTADPLDVTTFERVPSLVCRDEDAVTYPRFVDGPGDELAFTYRDGGSGDGRRLLNAYDPAAGTWRRLLDEPLLDGRGEANAYPHGPVRGPVGDYHLAWVWRDTPDAATNHDVSYARSPDLESWERVDGTPLDLPVTADDGAVVDPVPAGAGLINGNVVVGFDAADRPVVSYHRFDADGDTQVYNARFEGTDGGIDAPDAGTEAPDAGIEAPDAGIEERPAVEGEDVERGENEHGERSRTLSSGWRRVRASDWDHRWAFGGRGSLDFEIDVAPVRQCDEGLVQPFRHAEYGTGRWILDPETLAPSRTDAPWHGLPDDLRRVEGDDDRLDVRWASDSSVDGPWADRDARTHALGWESLPPNRDRAHDDVPAPSTLRIYALS